MRKTVQIPSKAIYDWTTTLHISLCCRLQGVDSADSQYRWRWYDTTSPGHFRETETNGTVTKMNYTIVYPSSVVSER